VRIHPTALKHGVEPAAIEHALRHPIAVIAINPEHDPRRLLTIGPGHAGQMLEVIVCLSTTMTS